MATATLRTGINILEIIYIIYLKDLYSIINYIQKAGYTGRAGEYITTIIIIKDKNWLVKDPKKNSYLKLKIYKINSLIQTKDYRYSILSQYLDNNLQNYKKINTVLYNNYQ